MFQDFNRCGVSVGNWRCRFSGGHGEQPYLVDLRRSLCVCDRSHFLLLPPLPEIKNEWYRVHRADIHLQPYLFQPHRNKYEDMLICPDTWKGMQNAFCLSSALWIIMLSMCLYRAKYLKLYCYFHRKATLRKACFSYYPWNHMFISLCIPCLFFSNLHKFLVFKSGGDTPPSLWNERAMQNVKQSQCFLTSDPA